jgi:Tol biopolymer transport system component
MRAALLLAAVTGCHAATATAPAITAASSEHACAAALPQLASEHTPNRTRIYLVPLAASPDHVELGAPVLATSKQGYVNQPAFLADGSGMYFTWRPAGSQADIWLRDLRTREERPVTCSSEEEYVASPAPDRQELTVVRVDPDRSRRLVVLGLDGAIRRALFPTLTSIGAYRWADDHTIAILAGEPDGSFAIWIGDVSTGALDKVAHHVRAALATIPGRRAVSYVDDSDPDHLQLRSIDLATHATAQLLSLPDSVDNIAWLSDGSVLAARGTQILRASAAAPDWREVASLAGKIEGTISRLVVSPDQQRLAVVVALPVS